MGPWYYYIETTFFGIIGIWVFMLSFGIHLPPVKNEVLRKKFDKWAKEYGNLMRVWSFIMIVVSVLSFPDFFSNSDVNKTVIGWTSTEKKLFVSNCIESAITMKKKYPEITHQYCECALQKIMDSMTYEEYFSTLDKTKEEQTKIVVPILRDCLNDFSRKIDSTKSLGIE